MPFSLYGVLSPELDTQSIRVFPVETIPTLGTPGPLDAVLTSLDVTTGERHTWRDSVVADRRGMHGHIFWAPFRAEVGHEYRIEALRPSDGSISYAEVTIPQGITARIIEENAAKLLVAIEGSGFRPLNSAIRYSVRAAVRADTAFYPILKLDRSYAGKEERSNGGWLLRVDVLNDARFVAFAYEDSTNIPLAEACPRLSLHRLTLEALVGDESWDPPDGLFDPVLLADPGIMRNVVNGFGFVGGGYHASVPLFPSRTAVELGCFVYAL